MRVLFHAVNGTGLGHLTRATLLARALARRVASFEGLLGTNAADRAALVNAPFKVLQLPYTNLDEVAAGEDPTPREVNWRAFAAAGRTYEPDLVVLDTHVPAAFLRDRTFAACARALVLRTLSGTAAERLFAGVAQAFDRILVPADLGAPPLPALARAPPLAARLVPVGPILRRAPSPADRARARARFGLTTDGPVVVASLGGGGPQVAPGKRAVLADAAEFGAAAARALALLQEKHPRGRFFLQIGPHAPADLEGAIAPGITVFRFDPDFPALLAEADLAITLAGYNTTWEIVQARVPAILLCKRSRYESQWDRALALVSRGAAEGPLGEPDVEGLRAQAEALLSDPPRRERMSAALAAIPVGDGVEEAAQALLALMRGPIPVLPAPPPCSSPCTGCPVDPARETPLSLFELAARGERRVLLSCSHGREASLPERMAEVHAAGLEPLLETTGRMALRRPEVRALIAAAVPARLLFFGLAKGLHDRASGEAGSFVATQELAGAVPGSGPFAAWSLCTARHGQARQDTLEPIDRHAFLHSPKHGAGDVLPAVAILRRRWLPYSEVFIHTEAAALRRHRPIAICREMVGERLPGIPVWPLGDLPSDRVAKRLARFPVAVAHAAFATCATTFLGLARALGVPLVVSARGHDIYREDLSHLGPVFEAAARVLARTEEMAADLVALGCPPDKVRVLPTGVDLGRFPFREPAPPEGGLRVVTVGRFTAKKGIPDALRAFAVLATAVPQARIHVLGLGHPDEDPAIVAEARDLAGRAPLAGRVELLPAVPQPELSQALARSHLFLCASRAAPNGDREGLPNAVKEAMAVGLPVVATRHSAIPGLLGPDGSGEPAGVLAPEADPEALGAALLDLAGRPEEWPALARVARRRVEERFDLLRIVDQLETLYEALQQRA